MIVVDCPEQQQITRTMQRSGLTETAVRAIMNQQFDRNRRLQLADEIIHNDGSLPALSGQVQVLHSRLISL
jgi:dephospho-CoA kinase